MYTFRVLKITNNLENYPECEKDTLEFPSLVAEVSDEMETFILNLETNRWFPANEFFMMVDLESFYVRDGVRHINVGNPLK